MANVGDKFIIEIGDVVGDNLYKIKGFNALVFDDNGLKKLRKYDDPCNKEYSPGDIVESGCMQYVVTGTSSYGTVYAISKYGTPIEFSLDEKIFLEKVNKLSKVI